MTISNQASQTRKALGFNIQQLADLCGVHRNTLSQWERGVRQPPAIAEAALVAVYCLAEHGLLDIFVKRIADIKKEEIKRLPRNTGET